MSKKRPRHRSDSSHESREGSDNRWPEWIKLMDSAGLTRSMSKKGCSLDNSACEGFLGISKPKCLIITTGINVPLMILSMKSIIICIGTVRNELN